MNHGDLDRGMKISLDNLSPESVTNAQSIGKVVTSSTDELDFHGCAMELLPYYPGCDPRPGTNPAA